MRDHSLTERKPDNVSHPSGDKPEDPPRKLPPPRDYIAIDWTYDEFHGGKRPRER